VIGSKAVLALALAGVGLIASRAQGAPELPATTPRPPLPLVLELHTGWQGPLGAAGLALVFDRGGRLSVGAGLGLEPGIPNALPAFGLFGRARLLRVGPLWLGATATFSRVHVEVDRQYERPPAGAYAPDQLHWSWEPGYRASGALAAEIGGQPWSLRLEGGVGYLLNAPRCSFENGLNRSYGSCDDPNFPAAYRFAVQPGRLIPSVTTSLGYRFGVDRPPARKSPATAVELALLATAAPITAGLIVATSDRASSHTKDLGWVAVVGGIVLGPSAADVYTEDYLRASGLAAARGLALLAGSYLFLSSTIRSSDCEGSQCDTSVPGTAAGFALLLAVPVLVGYEIFGAPASARRANARNGLAGLGVAPTVVTTGRSQSSGLALAGRF